MDKIRISCRFCLQQGLDVGGQLLIFAGGEEQLTELFACNGSLEQVLVDALQALDQGLEGGSAHIIQNGLVPHLRHNALLGVALTVAKADADNAEAVATMIAEGGIYIEDYSDIEQQVAEIAHVDLIEQELLDKPRDTVIIHMYLEPGASPVETLALIQARMEAAGIAYTVETEGVEQEDWQNGWRKYYHPMDIGKRLAIVPSWQEYDTDRVKLILDPGLAFGTGGHETTSLCLEALDERVRGGERVLDIGTGSGILAIAALKLGAASAEGVDIDPVAVRTAGENAALNGVQDKLTVLVGDLSDKASGTYDIITANIVANAILSLAPAVPGLMAEGATFIASGIIDSRKDEVIAGLEKAGLAVAEVKEKRGWECIVCKKA